MMSIRLLYFASDRTIGLSSLCTSQALAIHRYAKDDIALFCISGDKEQEIGLADSLIKEDVDLSRIKGLDEHKNFIWLSKEVRKIVTIKNISHIHVQNNWQLALVVFMKLFLLYNRKIKIIYTLHGFRHNHFLKSILARIVIGISLYLFANKVICMSKYLKNKFALLSRKLKLIYLGVPQDFFDYQVSIERNVVMPMIFVFPGQFRKGKGQELLIRSFARYINGIQDADSQLFLPGSGEMMFKLKALCLELKVLERVHFLGQLTRTELIQCYSKANILVVPSNSETFGQTIAEGIVLGKCVVSRSVGISPEIIKDGYNGFIFDSEDDLVRIFLRLHQNRDEIGLMGARIAESRELFSWESIVKRYSSECF